MKGWVMVEEGAFEDDDDLRRWIEMGVQFAQSLPPK
jgi:hypothetical protein